MHMPRLAVMSLLLAFGSPGSAGTAAARSADEQSALASFESLLEGLGQRDKAAMLAHSLPGGHATLMRQGRPIQITLEELADQASAPGRDTHQETITDPLVRVDHDVAIVWARFEFLVNGKIDHCGRDVAVLVKVGGHWLVASLEDTASPTCDH